MKRTTSSLYIPDAFNCDTQDNFTIIPNKLINDPSLSWKATGILIYLLQNKNKKGWKTYLKSLYGAKQDGKTGVDSGLQELEENGYLLRFLYYDQRNKVRGSFFAFTSTPFKYKLKPINIWVKKQGWRYIPSTKTSKRIVQELREKRKKDFLKSGFLISENRSILINKNIKNKEYKKEKIPKRKNGSSFNPLKEFIQKAPQIKDPKLIKLANTWFKYRQEINKPLKTSMAIKTLVNKFLNYPDDIQEMIEKSIEYGWIGLFPLDNYQSKNTHKNTKEIPKEKESNGNGFSIY